MQRLRQHKVSLYKKIMILALENGGKN